MRTAAKIEFGDFQTPLPLAAEICALLRHLGEAPAAVVEPTVGRGAFLLAAAEAFPQASLHGWDINPEHLAAAERSLIVRGFAARAALVAQDFFAADWDGILARTPSPLLILGNLPWVTNAAVSTVSGSNLPLKENFLGLRGLAARTGKANFDISEWMLIRLLHALGTRRATLAMLCKSATARKVLRYAWQQRLPVADAALFRIDAAAHFGAAVDACLLSLRTGVVGLPQAPIYPSLALDAPSATLGLAGKELVADIAAYHALRHLEGASPVQWRSGVKHDCAGVMELKPAPGGFINTAGETCSLEADYLFPLLKCSDLANGRLSPARFVLITQRKIGDDTAAIATVAPRTWAYLQAHAERFGARKSSIYRGRPSFALFGVGPYAFAPWKVAVSGLHHSARFQVLGPVDGKPVFFDDASYYLPFERESEARLIAEILNSLPCRRFLATLMFPDAKRSLTVELLQRLNLAAIAEEAGLASRWRELRIEGYCPVESHLQAELVMETRPTAN